MGAELGEESGPGIDVGETGRQPEADSLYAAAAWCAYVHCDTVGHGPCSSRQGGRRPPLVGGLA